MPTDRRTFLQLLTSGAAAAAFPSSIARALAIPANNRKGTIEDVEHIVFMMQENRSFDHYFGTLRGVRGYDDPRAVKLPSGDPVWQQPSGSSYVLPFHPPAPSLGLQFLEDLAHDWTTTHEAWNVGKYDQWVPSKGAVTMAHLTRSDIPFHYALADAFTVCDAYHCSLLGPTDPNRYHMWTGWVGNDGSGGGPVIDNAEAGYGWSTFPERLESAGISWKIYQDAGAGLDAAHFWGWGDDAYIGNYGDNSLLYFHQYQNAPAGSPLAEKARTGTNISTGGTLFDIFLNDVKTNNLPQVSWVVAPEAYTEHPNWPANYGAWYVSQMLDALTSNPGVWSKTAFFLMYDENDGFFDHIVPPTPPQTRAQGISTVPTTNEIYPGYDLSVHGPNGFFRSYKGSISANPAAELEVRAQYEGGHITLELRNAGKASCQVSILNGYTQQRESLTLRSGEAKSRQWRLEETHGWYDLLVDVEADAHFQRHIAGHVETGRDSVTDPAIGKASSD
ncbi:MAG: phospholipase [Acidobacteriaceae bacterium]|nr:phospholipase [Acidobacteriaceae bacterium]